MSSNEDIYNATPLYFFESESNHANLRTFLLPRLSLKTEYLKEVDSTCHPDFCRGKPTRSIVLPPLLSCKERYDTLLSAFTTLALPHHVYFSLEINIYCFQVIYLLLRSSLTKTSHSFRSRPLGFVTDASQKHTTYHSRRKRTKVASLPHLWQADERAPIRLVPTSFALRRVYYHHHRRQHHSRLRLRGLGRC